MHYTNEKLAVDGINYLLPQREHRDMLHVPEA